MNLSSPARALDPDLPHGSEPCIMPAGTRASSVAAAAGTVFQYMLSCHNIIMPETGKYSLFKQTSIVSLSKPILRGLGTESGI